MKVGLYEMLSQTLELFGWLFDYRFLAVVADENLLSNREEYENVSMRELRATVDNAERFSFEMPVIRRYDQPNPTFGEIFNRIAVVLGLFVGSILVMWVLTWVNFMRYDVR